MSERDKEELARLLGAMAAGQHEPDEGEVADEGVVLPVQSSQAALVSRASHRPALPVAVDAPPRVAVIRPRQHLVQTLGFKRTIIPILLTLGVLCLVLGLMGFFVSPVSPYAKLAERWFSVPMVLVGLVTLGFGILTMFQVRSELSRRGP